MKNKQLFDRGHESSSGRPVSGCSSGEETAKANKSLTKATPQTGSQKFVTEAEIRSRKSCKQR